MFKEFLKYILTSLLVFGLFSLVILYPMILVNTAILILGWFFICFIMWLIKLI